MLLSICVVRFENGTERRISPLSALANGMQQFPDTIALTLMAKCDAFGAPVMHRHNEMEADRGMLAHLGACIEHCAKTEILSRDHVMSFFSTKKAALIFYNMCSMVNDAKDLTLYLDTICRQTLLLDSIPECRTVSSKARGMLVKGQSHFPHLVERFVVALEDALCNALSEVRRAAGDTLDVFHKSMDYRSIDELTPRLLKRITSVLP
ncbi:hypothetical protein SDRG_11419 [Saprolegnia diclina VS20]|uniref:Uncharacterized protein n=1 Tax=Saprolegnia diclina (strain VS20) TaxID=1156394 RepID=T0PZE6_SAPDV|nr:hypothetical protein SDRG_11419 [Saprolegnia diclina VS20]EQC30944.1 hypothetical protein SDRG_11419 [Saprolegnia diclina VS20]|eukprot:XP_008615682.1 hypothetical protein SDRG_11419 [Saprolegnia diclina VS20]